MSQTILVVDDDPSNRVTLERLLKREGYRVDHAESGRVFDAVLSLERRPWTTRSLARELGRHPIMPAEVVASIYWQAAKLFIQKRAPSHPHPDGAVEPTEITS